MKNMRETSGNTKENKGNFSPHPIVRQGELKKEKTR